MADSINAPNGQGITQKTMIDLTKPMLKSWTSRSRKSVYLPDKIHTGTQR